MSTVEKLRAGAKLLDRRSDTPFKYVAGANMERFLKQAGIPDEMIVRIDKIRG